MPSYLISRAARLLGRVGDGRLRALGFGMGQIPVLGALKDGAALSQKELAERAQVEQPTMAEMLARMHRSGIVRRAVDPNDRRGSRISLTAAARARLPAAREVLMRSNQEALRGLDADEIATLTDLLRRVIANLEAMNAAPEGAAAAPVDE